MDVFKDIIDLKRVLVPSVKIKKVITHIVVPVYPEKIKSTPCTRDEKLQLLVEKVRNVYLVTPLSEPIEIGGQTIKPEVHVISDYRVSIILQKCYYFRYLVDVLYRLSELRFVIERENDREYITWKFHIPPQIVNFLCEIVGWRSLIFELDDRTYSYNTITDSEADKLIISSYEVLSTHNISPKDIAFEMLKIADLDELLIADHKTFENIAIEAVENIVSRK